MRIANCHILFFSLVFLLCAAPVQGKTLSIEHAFFKYDKDSNIHTYTSPRVTYGDTTISSREMRYDKNTEIMYFSGNIVIRPPGIVLTADKATFDSKTGKNTLFKSTMYDSKNGVFIDAERIEQINDETYVIYQGSLTRCSPGSKAWELRGRQIHYTVDNYAYSLGTSVHFYTLPIFYSPYFSWPTKQGRSSGLLIPVYSSVDSANASKSYGARLQLPYFIALDQDHDVTITPDMIQRRGLGVGIDYLYAFTPDMSGQFQTWFIKETQQARNLDIEPLGSLSPTSDSIDLHPLRYKYRYDHRQNIFLDGQFRFHQHENSDNEINKEYFGVAVGFESHFSQTFSLVFPWDSGSFSMAYETADKFTNKSIYDKETNKETYLNRQPTATVSQRYSRIADTPLSVNLSGTGTQYTRIYGWNGQYTLGTVTLKSPFVLDFLNIAPTLGRSYYGFDTRYQAEPGNTTLDPQTYGWTIDNGELELNFEIYRLFYNYDNIATSKLKFRPRIIYREIQDVDQSEDDDAALLSTIPSQKTLTYKLETRYLVKNPVNKAVRTYFSLDLTQIYNLQMEEDQIFFNQPAKLETEQGDPQLPLRIALSVSPTSLFTAGLFYRYDHEKERVVETKISLATRSSDGNRFSLNYIDNETAYREPDNSLQSIARKYTISHSLRLNNRWTLNMAGAWNQNRSNLSYQYGGTQTVKLLDRQLTDLTTAITYRHDCYNFSASYVEDIESEVLQGVTTEFLEKKVTVTIQFQVMPTNTKTFNQTTGAQYQQGFLLPN
jgi:lipopolysaccharide assembly outer membrane protein LptD (OstA)